MNALLSRLTAMFSFIPEWQQSLDSRLANLPQRDRNALTILAIFLGLSVLYGVFALHQHANTVERRALSAQNELFWMRAQAPHIQSAQQQNTTSLRERINQKASQQGMTVQVVEVGDNAQLSLSHANAAVLGNFLAGLTAENMVFDRLAINQKDNLDVQAEATVRNGS